EPLVRDTHREDDAPGRDVRASGDRDGVRGVPDGKMCALTGEREPRAEDPRLLIRALRELSPAQPPREPEVVPDTRARSGLAADRLELADERAQALGRTVHG